MDEIRYARKLIEAADPKNIPNYGYWGELPRGVNWGNFIARNRDSDILTNSNWDCIVRDLEKKFGEEDEENGWVIENASHWLCGWVEVLYIKYFEQDINEFPDQELTPIGEWAIEVYTNLEESYPVYDEDHFSNAEFEEHQSYISNEFYDPEEEALAWHYIDATQMESDYYPEWGWKEIEEIKSYVELAQWDWGAIKAECQDNIETLSTEIEVNEKIYEDALNLICKEKSFTWKYGADDMIELTYQFEKQDERLF